MKVEAKRIKRTLGMKWETPSQLCAVGLTMTLDVLFMGNTITSWVKTFTPILSRT